MALAVAVVVLLGIAEGWRTAPSPENSAKDMRGNTVRYDADAVPSPGASAVPDGSGRFIVQSLGLDVPLGLLDAVDGSVIPPGFISAYLIRNYGVTPDRAREGTVYVVMHSLRKGGIGPGNYLIDVDKGKARIPVGEEISVDDVRYRVVSSDHVKKSSLPGNSIWRNVPGRLIVITCLQRPDNRPSRENIIIRAQRI